MRKADAGADLKGIWRYWPLQFRISSAVVLMPLYVDDPVAMYYVNKNRIPPASLIFLSRPMTRVLRFYSKEGPSGSLLKRSTRASRPWRNPARKPNSRKMDGRIESGPGRHCMFKLKRFYAATWWAGSRLVTLSKENASFRHGRYGRQQGQCCYDGDGPGLQFPIHGNGVFKMPGQFPWVGAIGTILHYAQSGPWALFAYFTLFARWVLVTFEITILSICFAVPLGLLTGLGRNISATALSVFLLPTYVESYSRHSSPGTAFLYLLCAFTFFQVSGITSAVTSISICYWAHTWEKCSGRHNGNSKRAERSCAVARFQSVPDHFFCCIAPGLANYPSACRKWMHCHAEGYITGIHFGSSRYHAACQKFCRHDLSLFLNLYCGSPYLSCDYPLFSPNA